MPEAAQEYTLTVQTHEHRGHSTDWYWALGSIAVLGAGGAVFFGNGLLAIILLVGMGSIGILAARGPREHALRIGPRGVSVDGTHHNWKDVRSYWIEHDVENPRFTLSFIGVLWPHITIHLESAEEGEELREYLKQFSTEAEHGLHPLEYLAEMVGL